MAIATTAIAAASIEWRVLAATRYRDHRIVPQNDALRAKEGTIMGHVNVTKKGIYEPTTARALAWSEHNLQKAPRSRKFSFREYEYGTPPAPGHSSCTEQTAKMRNAEPKKHESAVQALHPPQRHPALFAASGVLRQRIRRSTIHCIITSLIDED